jgi:hypothetical protein
MEALLTNLVQRIREEFEEAPGLRLTLGEAARFWGLDEPIAERVLARLFATGFLVLGDDGRFQQSEALASRSEQEARRPGALRVGLEHEVRRSGERRCQRPTSLQ